MTDLVCGDLRGTYSGYQRHIREGDSTCDECKKAKADYNREYIKKNGNDRQLKLQGARNKARARLASLHRREYLVLYNEEMEKAGLT